MTDILGPADAPHAVTVRPLEDRTFSTLDSWFKDCSGPSVDDGTEIHASWMNGMLASLRSLWRSNGKLADNITNIVLEAGTDDDGLTKAVQHLIQRGKPKFAVDTGTKNNLVVTLAPTPPEYTAGMMLKIRAKFSNDGATVINVNGLGNRKVLRTSLQELSQNDVPASGMIVIVDDGNGQFQLVSGGGNGGGGSVGPQGPQGVQGNDGARGVQGVQGTQGIQGPPGTFPLTPGAIGSLAFSSDFGSGVARSGAQIYNGVAGAGTYAGTWQPLSVWTGSLMDGLGYLTLYQRIA